MDGGGGNSPYDSGDYVAPPCASPKGAGVGAAACAYNGGLFLLCMHGLGSNSVVAPRI